MCPLIILFNFFVFSRNVNRVLKGDFFMDFKKKTTDDLGLFGFMAEVFLFVLEMLIRF